MRIRQSILGISNVRLDDLELLYQPMFDLQTRKVVAAEALLRWNHPLLGQLAPGDFLPEMLASRRLGEITRWIFRTAVQQLAKWHACGFEHITMSINASLEELRDGSLPDHVLKAVNAAGLRTRNVEIEISERGSVIESPQALDTIRRLSAQGFGIAVDDFGAGSASLRYLLDIPATTIKVDRSFVAGDPRDRHALVLERTCSLARELGYRVVVEGIEDEVHLDLAVRALADYGQGHYLGLPLSPAVLESCL